MHRTVLVLAAWSIAVAGAAQSSLPTEEVFRRFSDRVVKIEIQESGSAAKSSMGSGFFVSPDGHLVTNYHVVADVVREPERYLARIVDAADEEVPVEVLAIDVAHDLAVVKASRPTPSHFSLAPIEVDQGARLYSLGHPLDLGLNIVEGTYNGFLRHALDERINFTGSINSGMSGGPAINSEGRVAGVNVASYGEQVSFLVPVKSAVALLGEVLEPGFSRPESFDETVRAQALAWQESFVSTLLEGRAESVVLGGVSLPTEPAPFFNCWADAYREDDVPYESVDHSCSTDDYLYLSDDLISGQVWFYHRLVTTDELNRFQFDALRTDEFHRTYHGLSGGENDVTEFRCHTDTVSESGLPLKAVLCIRGYVDLDGLYDLVLKGAVLGDAFTGVETLLVASGVSFDNAKAVAEWYLRHITWAE